MKYQRHPWTCGPAAIVNAARAHGRRVSERSVAVLCETTEEDGTTETGIRAGITGLGFGCEEYEGVKRSEAWFWLESQLLIKKSPVICCVQEWSHWVAVIGKAGDRIIYVDSANTIRNMGENGVHVASKRDFLKKWGCRDGSGFYGISMIKRTVTP